MFNIPRHYPYALVGEAYTSLTKMERFTASYGFIGPLTAARYFHSFEYRVAQIIRRSNRFNTNEIVVQPDTT